MLGLIRTLYMGLTRDPDNWKLFSCLPWTWHPAWFCRALKGCFCLKSQCLDLAALGASSQCLDPAQGPAALQTDPGCSAAVHLSCCMLPSLSVLPPAVLRVSSWWGGLPQRLGVCRSWGMQLQRLWLQGCRTIRLSGVRRSPDSVWKAISLSSAQTSLQSLQALIPWTSTHFIV